MGTSGTEGKMTDLTWTDERPTKAGWYWWKNDLLRFSAQVCNVRHLQGWEDELFVCFIDGNKFRMAEMNGGQWSSAPIDPPKEA